MIFKERSERMLKYEKSKAKLVEFDVKKEDYPRFPMNSDDLVYTTLFILSRYCEELIVDPDSQTTSQLFVELTSAAQYYNAAVNSEQWLDHNHLFLLLGATAYFMSEDFGSAKVLISRIHDWCPKDNLSSLLYFTLCFLLLDTAYPSELQKESHTQYAVAMTQHFSAGTRGEPIFSLLSDIRQESLFVSDILDITYADFLYGVSFRALCHSAWFLLPQNSRASMEKWGGYLSKPGSVRLLWPAQKIIVEAGALRGQDLIVPFPTGVGKTRSIELIIRSVFMEQGKRVALVVAPLRALCNEITQDLTAASMTAVINQFSDTAQEDFDLKIQENQKYILICTPEKFTYILRHQPDVLPEINLFIFDEGSVIITDTGYFDNRKKQTGGGNYKWESCKKMFDYRHTEPCGSAILQLVSPLKVDYNIRFEGETIAKCLVEHYGAPDCFASLKEQLKTAYQQLVPVSRFQKYNYMILD